MQDDEKGTWISRLLRRIFSSADDDRYTSDEAALVDPRPVADLDDAETRLTLATFEAALTGRPDAEQLPGRVLLALEAYRRHDREWPERLDKVLGQALAYARRHPRPVGDALRAAVAAIPLERRWAMLWPHLANSLLTPADCLGLCPTAQMLGTVAIHLSQYESPAASLRLLLRGVDGPTELVAGAIERRASDPYLGGLIALLPLAVEANVLGAPERFVEAIVRAYTRNTHPPGDEFQRALAQLPLAVREAVCREVPISDSPFGPHAVTPTLAVARSAVTELCDGVGVNGARVLNELGDDLVHEAFKERDGTKIAPRNWTTALAFAQRHGVHLSCDAEHPLAQVRRVETVATQHAVLDLVPVAGGVLATGADGTLVLLAETGREQLVEGSECAPCRVAAVTDDEIVLWGWESLIAVSRTTGKHRWSLELGHSLDEDGGECHVFGSLLMLPIGWLVDLGRRAFVPTPDGLAESTFYVHSVDREGFVVARGSTLYRLGPDLSLTQLAELGSEIRAIVGVDPLTLVLGDGRVSVVGEAWEGLVALEAPEITGRLQTLPEFPAKAQASRGEHWLAVAANNGHLSGSKLCFSCVVVWVSGEEVFSREYRGHRAIAAGVAAPIVVPEGIVVPGPVVRELSLPGLAPTAACQVGQTLLIGTSGGVVLFVDVS